MKIIVTGGAGFMGSHLVDALLAEGHDVWSVDDLSGGYEENVNPKAHFVQLDLRDKKGVEELFREVKPELVYHLAADATEGRSQFMPVECTERGYNAYLHVLTSAIRHGTKKMVHTSSMSVYGEQKPPFSEELEPDPADIYAISKAAQEKATKLLHDVYGIRYTIIRPHNVYGPRQNMADPYRNVIAIFMNCALKNKPFYIYGDGEQKRSFSYIDDQIPCFVRAGFDKATDGEIFNIGPTQEHTINQVAKMVLEVSGSQHKPIYMPPRPLEVKEAWCTNEKAVRMLGYKHTMDLKDGLKVMWEWAKQRGPQETKYVDKLELENGDVPRTWKEKLI